MFRVNEMILEVRKEIRFLSPNLKCSHRPKKNTCVSANMLKRIRVGRLENIFFFFFCLIFVCNKSIKKYLLQLNIINIT